jgi:uncharacterized protein YutE (UPF0331/DUF86 family)
MSDNSPLFVSAIELLAHATEIFAQGDAKKNKFVILHLANAVELIVKDCVIDQGISIYDKEKKQNTTITIWKCLSILESKSINVPELPVLELLIDDRNTIQHRFGYPDQKTVDYYLQEVVRFFQRFLDTHYGLKLSETLAQYLSNEHLKILGLIQDQYQDTLNQLAKVSPEAAIVKAYNFVEELLLFFLNNYLPERETEKAAFISRNQATARKLFNDLEQIGFIEKEGYERLMELRKTRNRAAHSAVENLEDIDWQKNLKIAEELINGLQQAKQAGYQFTLDNHKKDDSSEADD